MRCVFSCRRWPFYLRWPCWPRSCLRGAELQAVCSGVVGGAGGGKTEAKGNSAGAGACLGSALGAEEDGRCRLFLVCLSCPVLLLPCPLVFLCRACANVLQRSCVLAGVAWFGSMRRAEEGRTDGRKAFQKAKAEAGQEAELVGECRACDPELGCAGALVALVLVRGLSVGSLFGQFCWQVALLAALELEVLRLDSMGEPGPTSPSPSPTQRSECPGRTEKGSFAGSSWPPALVVELVLNLLPFCLSCELRAATRLAGCWWLQAGVGVGRGQRHKEAQVQRTLRTGIANSQPASQPLDGQVGSGVVHSSTAAATATAAFPPVSGAYNPAIPLSALFSALRLPPDAARDHALSPRLARPRLTSGTD